jgi:hypothetical protein
MARITTRTNAPRKPRISKKTSIDVIGEAAEPEMTVQETVEVVETAQMEVEPVEEVALEEERAVQEDDVKASSEPVEDIVSVEEAPKKTPRKRAARKKVPKEPITQEEEQSIPMDVTPKAVETTPTEVETPVVEPAPKKRAGRKKASKNPVTQARTRFGWVEVNGVRHEHDSIIHADGTVTKRDKTPSRDKKEKYGHVPLTRKELKPLLSEDVKLVFIGTGQSGAMPVTPKAMKMLEELKAVVKPTPELIEEMLASKEKFIALLHVTC